ncbi:MAG TPA: ATP-binding protein [Longimicrobiales bacterium]|nr:ATP-binding protein [Longimicrobiales bacterium]
MKVVPVPASLDESSFDALADGVAAADGQRVLLDARRLRWVDPYGAVGLLAAGEVAGRTERPVLQLPAPGDVLSYLGRMDFFRHAGGIFEIHGDGRRAADGASDVLLEVTRVESHGDVHLVVDRVHERAGAILSRQLHYPPALAMQFGTILSEVCQNIMEHAQAPGWVAAQTYNWQKRLGRKVVVVAVMDLGVGFQGSLAGEHAARYGDGWGDAAALEAAFIHGLTRFRDPGRGQGLQQIRKLVGRVGGKISIRSGTARIADVPDWDDAKPLEERLAPFPGTQIVIVLPARVEAEA